MKVKKSAWHYRMITKTWEGYYPKTICGYFWIVVGTSLIWMTLAPIIGPLIPLALLILWLLDKREERQAGRKPKERKERKEPGVVRAYLSAKKRRVCPLIEII